MKTKHLGNLQSGSELPKEIILCLRGAVFISCAALWAGPGQGQVNAASWEAVAASSWVTEQSLPSIHEPLPWLCCSVRLHPDISVLVPIDPSLYCWRAQHFSPLIPSAGWVSSTIRASVAPAGITPVPAASLQSSSLTCTLTIFSSGQCYSEEHLFTVRNEVLEGMEGRCSVFIQYQWFHNKKVTASHD